MGMKKRDLDLERLRNDRKTFGLSKKEVNKTAGGKINISRIETNLNN